MHDMKKKNVAQEGSSMSRAFWAMCQACGPRTRGIQLLPPGCGTLHTTDPEASGHVYVLNRLLLNIHIAGSIIVIL